MPPGFYVSGKEYKPAPNKGRLSLKGKDKVSTLSSHWLALFVKDANFEDF